MSRATIDEMLYQLSRADLIELSSIVDTSPYTVDQLQAGIQQDVGGSLFFIIVNEQPAPAAAPVEPAATAKKSQKSKKAA